MLFLDNCVDDSGVRTSSILLLSRTIVTNKRTTKACIGYNPTSLVWYKTDGGCGGGGGDGERPEHHGMVTVSDGDCAEELVVMLDTGVNYVCHLHSDE